MNRRWRPHTRRSTLVLMVGSLAAASCGQATDEVSSGTTDDTVVAAPDCAADVETRTVETEHGDLIVLGARGTAVATDPDPTIGATAASLHVARQDDHLAYSVPEGDGDLVMVSQDGGRTWAQLSSTPAIRSLALSASGSLLAVAGSEGVSIFDLSNGRLTGVGDAPETLDQLTFVGDDLLYGVVSESVPGVSDEFASLSNLVAARVSDGVWTTRTDFETDLDRWTLVFTPKSLDGSTVAFVRVTGLGSGGIEDVEAWIETADPSSNAIVSSVPVAQSTLLVGTADGETIVAQEDALGARHLRVIRGGQLIPLLCGDPGGSDAQPAGTSVEQVQSSDDPDLTTPGTSVQEADVDDHGTTNPEPVHRFDLDEYDALAESWLDAYLDSFDPAFAPLELWLRGPGTPVVVGTVVSADIGQFESSPASREPCDSSSGTTTAELCDIPAHVIGTVRVTLAVTDLVQPPGTPESPLRLDVGDHVTIDGNINAGIVGGSHTSLLPAVAARFLPGMTIVSIVSPGDQVLHGLSAGGWGVVDDEGGLHVPMDPSWPRDMNIAPFATLDELLGAARAA